MLIEGLRLSSRNLLRLLTCALLAIPVAAFGHASSAFNMPAPCRAEQEFSRAAETLIAERINAERARLMTFGAGPTRCLGANLARAGLQEALTFLAPRMPGLRSSQPAVFGSVQGIYHLDELHLEWD